MFTARITSVAVGLGIVACSSASTPDAPTSREDNSVRVPSFGRPTEATAAASTSTPEPPPVAPPSTPTQNRPPPAPAPECPDEGEPNNEKAQATEFTNCVTGELTTWTDNDYLKITAPDDAEGADMIIDHIESGKIQYQVTFFDGTSGDFNVNFTDRAPAIKARAGKTYLFSLKWANDGQGAVSDSRHYAIRVLFQ